MGTVFISYGNDTKALAVELNLALRATGFETWIDLKDVKAGEAWTDSIERAVEEADRYDFVVSPQSRACGWLDGSGSGL